MSEKRSAVEIMELIKGQGKQLEEIGEMTVAQLVEEEGDEALSTLAAYQTMTQLIKEVEENWNGN